MRFGIKSLTDPLPTSDEPDQNSDPDLRKRFDGSNDIDDLKQSHIINPSNLHVKMFSHRANAQPTGEAADGLGRFGSVRSHVADGDDR